MVKLSSKIKSILLKKAEKLNIVLLGLIIIFVRLPPFYIFIKNPLFLSSIITRFLILTSFFLTLLVIKAVNYRKKTFLYILISLYLLSQTLSILNTINIMAFLSTYQSLFFSILLFFSVANNVNKKNVKILITALIFSSIINLSFQIFVYFFPTVVTHYLQNILYEKYLQIFNYQAGRDRYFGDSFDEVILPLFFLIYLDKKDLIKKIGSILMVGIIFFITIISNWRTKAILFIFSLFSSLVIFIKKIKKQVFLFIAVCVFVLLTGSMISQKIVGFSVIDRFFGQDNNLSYENNSTQSRLIYWETAVEMGLGKPIFGVGLGNYFDNLSQEDKLKDMNSTSTRDFITIDDPHNIFLSIFASSGFLGLLAFVLMITYFLLTDIKSIKQKNFILNCFIASFWSLFIYSCLNPYLVFSYLCFLFFLRGLIEALNVIK